MLESSTSGARTVDEAVAGREGVPGPELVERAKRRSFTAYKARILAEVDACAQPGEVGECCVVRGCVRRS
jgi:hypothetical protein